MTIVYSLPPYNDFSQIGELIPLDDGRFAIQRADGGFLSLDRTGKFRWHGEPAAAAWESAMRVGDKLIYEAERAKNVAVIVELPA